MHFGLQLDVGTPVNYEFVSGSEKQVIPGTVRYKGPAEGSPSILFGVEITES